MSLFSACAPEGGLCGPRCVPPPDAFAAFSYTLAIFRAFPLRATDRPPRAPLSTSRKDAKKEAPHWADAFEKRCVFHPIPAREPPG
jgi:hypothetical protein